MAKLVDPAMWCEMCTCTTLLCRIKVISTILLSLLAVTRCTLLSCQVHDEVYNLASLLPRDPLPYAFISLASRSELAGLNAIVMQDMMEKGASM